MKKLHVTDEYLYYEKQYYSGPKGVRNWEALRGKLSEEFSGDMLNAETYFYYGFVFGTTEDVQNAKYLSKIEHSDCKSPKL